MKNKKLIIFLIFGLAIMAAMLYFIGIDQVVDALKYSNLWFVLLAVLLQIFTYFLYTWRWQIINKSAGMTLGIWKLLPMVLVSLAVNNITPSGRGGGEPVRAYLLAKEGHYKFEDTFATVIADRALDTFPFVILAILTIIAIIFSVSLPVYWIVILVLCVVGITAIVILLLYVCINEAFGVRLTEWILKITKRFYKNYNDALEKRIVEAVASFQSTMNALIRDKNIIYYALPLSFIIWVFEILRVYVVFLAFGAKVSPIIIGEVFILASLVGMVPLLPGGLGAIDGVMILFYSRSGITASLSAAATVVERSISFGMTTILGLIFLMKYGTSILDASFKLAESEKAENLEEITEDEQKILDQLSEDGDKSEDSDENREEAVLEVLDGEPSIEVVDEEPTIEVIDDEPTIDVLDEKEEAIDEKVKN
ncbi:hypothetical protein mru_2023 [Methanobrevibacter ruminantium M1]|uniref:Uncharacterized protein n=1 Tax=Methanobrevibacter ruminantium (strain ATCC 35063 / DSM 1093 / JCM 13430 / OCM 146 / M1) TaxID=634498 RepID=D3E0E9_METRM|nr:flippase-like domain-containing protein [Methanobrevibacter ruminantium]ADC47873.1 hypothetical protein mru_2023 [Methanobrevibacter ruminantium M1]